MTTPRPDDHYWTDTQTHHEHPPRWERADILRTTSIVAVAALAILTIVQGKIVNDRLQSVIQGKVETLAKVELVLERINQEVETLAVDRRNDVAKILEVPADNFDAIMANRKLQEAIAARIGMTKDEIETALKTKAQTK